MKKYFVSLGCWEPANWEVEVEAKNQREAIKEARNLFHDNVSLGEFTGVYGDAKLMGRNAVHVEELGDAGN